MSGAAVTTAGPTTEPAPDRPWLTWLSTVLRVVLAGVWVWAAVSKMGDPAASVRAVRAYRLLPEWLAKGVGYGLPFLELGLAVLLLVGLATRAAAAVSAALLVVFLVGIVSAAARDLQIECGCFGGGGDLAAGQSTAYAGEIIRDSGLLMFSILLVLMHRSRYALDDAVRSAGQLPAEQLRVGRRKTAESRRRLAELAEKRRQEGERRVRLASAATGIGLVALVAAGIGIQSARIPTPTGPAPTGAVLATGVTVGRATAPVTMDLWEDPQCPVCAQFEQQVGGQISSWLDQGTVKVNYHVISFLDRASSTRYSSRAANALYASAQVSPEVFVKYHALLFANQPAENSAGLTDDKLIELAGQAGAGSDTVTRAVRSGTYDDFVTRITDQSSKDGVNGTPTVKVNGTQLEQPTLDAVKAAVAAAGQ